MEPGLQLKLLDVSENQLSSLPAISDLRMLTTLNLALNSLEGDLEIAGLDQCDKLSVVDVSGNKSWSF